MTNQLQVQSNGSVANNAAQANLEARSPSYYAWLSEGVKSFCFGPEPVYTNTNHQKAAETLTHPLTNASDLKQAVLELFNIINAYPQFNTVAQLLQNKLRSSQFVFNEAETSAIKAVVRSLAKQMPKDAFLKKLDDHFHIEAHTPRTEASLELWNLYGEILHCDDAKIREILKSYSANGFILPPKAASYLHQLEISYPFERFINKEEQRKELYNVHTVLASFVANLENGPNKHALLNLLQEAQGFIYNPIVLTKSAQSTEIKNAKQEVDAQPKEEESSSQAKKEPSFFERAQTAFTSAKSIDVKQQVSEAINEAANSFSKNAHPDLDNATKALFSLKYDLENLRKPRIAQHVQKVTEALGKLENEPKLTRVVELLTTADTDLNTLKAAVAEAKLYVDNQISLQLGSGVKMTRAMLGEVRKSTDEILDDFERRMEKHVRRLCDAFGVNLDDAGVTEEHFRTVSVSEALKKLLGDASQEDIQETLEQLTVLITAPNKFIQRNWTQRENSILTQLQGALQHASLNHPLLDQRTQALLKEAIEVLAPFTASPMEKVLDSMSAAAADLITMTTTKAGAALSKRMTSQIASSMNILMENAKSALLIDRNGENVLADPKYKPIVDAIDQLIPQIRQAEQNGEVAAVSGLMTSMIEKFKQLPPIFLYKIPLFFKSTNSSYSSSPFSPYADGIKKDKEVLQRSALPNQPSVNVEEITNQNKKEFVRKSTYFAAMKGVYEMICGVVPADKKFFNKLLDEAQNVSNDPKIFKDTIREKFFEKIDLLHRDGEISIITKWLSKLFYRLAIRIIEPMTSRAADRFVDYVRELIIKRDEEGFFELQTQIVNNFNTFLGSLGDVYKNVNEKPLVPGSLLDKMKTESQQKQYYMDLDPKEFYKRVTVEASDKFYPNLRLTKKFTDWINSVKLNDDAIWKKAVNYTVLGIALPVIAPVWIVAWVVEKITNWIFLRFIVKKNLVNNEYLQKFLENRIDKIVVDNEYTHAVNTVIAEQLQEILGIMQNDYINKIKREEAVTVGSKQEHLRNELTRLISYLFEIIGKSKNLTDDQLNAFLKNKSISQKGKEAIDDFVIPETVNSIIKIAETGFASIMNTKQFERQLNNIFSMGIESYKAGKKVSDAEFEDKKQEIARISDQIMELTIREAVDKKFDFSVEPQKKEVNAFKENQKSCILNLHEHFYVKFIELKAALDANNRFMAFGILKEMISASEEFKIKRSKELYQQNLKVGLGNDIKDLFTDLSTTTAKKLEKIDDSLRDMYAALRNSENKPTESIKQIFQDAIPHVEAFAEWTESDELKEFEPIDFTFSQLSQVKAYMTQIARERVKERVDGLLKFFQDPLIYGMIARELVMKPFLRGELKLPNS